MGNIFELFKQIETSRPQMQGAVTALVVGLGNPGREYEMTRHNAGFMTLNRVAVKYGAAADRVKFNSLCGDCVIGERRVLLMLPQTFMNSSGEAVGAAASFYKVVPEDIFVFCDDVNLDIGKLRIRRSGSAGGHNGLKSIIEHLGSDAFHRIRIGVGKKPEGYDLADWVLSVFPRKDREALFSAMDKAVEALPLILFGETEKAMSLYN